MKKLLSLAFVLLTATIGAAELRVAAGSYPSSGLPGVTPYFHLQITNLSKEPLLVANYAKLTDRVGANEHEIRFGSEKEDSGLFMPYPVLLEKGETAEGVFGFAPNGWMFDPRLNAPAENVLTFHVPYTRINEDDRQWLESLSDRARERQLSMLLHDYDLTWVRSTPASYRVETPSGVDEEAWNYLKANSNNDFTAGSWSAELALGLLERIRWSGYTPEALLTVPTNIEGLEAYVDESISRFPNSAARPALAIRLASIREQRLVQFVDLNQAIEDSKKAKTAIDRVLVDESIPTFWRERLDGYRAGIPSEENLRLVKKGEESRKE